MAKTPLHLAYLAKYLRGDTTTVRQLPPEAADALRQVIEENYNPKPSLLEVLQNAVLGQDVKFKSVTQHGIPVPQRPRLPSQAIRQVYEHANPDSYVDLFGGSPMLQLARAIGQFRVTPDTTNRAWRVQDTYAFDKLDRRFSPADLWQTPTWAMSTVLNPFGKPFKTDANVPMSPEVLQAIRDYVVTNKWNNPTWNRPPLEKDAYNKRY